MNDILLVTDGWFHPSIFSRFWLSYILTGPGYRYEHIRSLEDTIDIDLETFQAMVLFFHQKVISPEALKAFDTYILNGGGALAIHSVTASFQSNNHFTNIIGGKFIKHGPIENIELYPSQDSDIFPGIKKFSIKDELYIHHLQPDIRVHFHTEVDGEKIPQVWTREHGKGRICYLSPGHKAVSFCVKEFQEIIMMGMEWVSGIRT